MNATPGAGERSRWAWMLAVVGIVVLPVLWRGNSCGHDFDFHIQSWIETARQWKQGVLYPHWVDFANYGAGEPRLVFYPPASWMLGALLGLVFPWNSVPAIWLLLVLAACAAAMYALAREWMPRESAALAACLYVANPYALFVVYERSAFAELMAGIWMPLLVLYALRKGRSLAPLALVIACVWLTNAPAAVMASYALALIALLAALLEHAWWPALRAAAAMPLGLSLAAFYLVPAAWERRWVEIQRAIVPGMRIQDSFLFGHIGESFHDRVLLKASSIAVALLCLIAIAAYASRRADPRRRSLRIIGLCFTAIILFLLLPPSLPLWQHAPQLRFLQFPWRWLLFLALFFALFAALALARLPAPFARRLRAGAILFAMAMACGAAIVSWQPCDVDDNVAAQLQTLPNDGFPGTDEYTPRTSDNEGIQQDLPQVRVLNADEGDSVDTAAVQNPEWDDTLKDTVPARVHVNDWQAEHKSVTVETPSAAFVVLRVVDYPAWLVRVNGEILLSRTRRNDGLITLPVAAGTTRIDLRYSTTPDRIWGRWITLAALLTWLTLLLYARRSEKLHRVS